MPRITVELPHELSDFALSCAEADRDGWSPFEEVRKVFAFLGVGH